MYSKRVLWSLLWLVLFENHQIEGPKNKSSEEGSSSSHGWFYSARMSLQNWRSKNSSEDDDSSGNSSNEESRKRTAESMETVPTKKAKISKPTSHLAENPLMRASQLSDLGLQYKRENNEIAALNCFNKAIRKHPTELQYYRERSICNWNVGNFQAAIDDLRHVVEKNPENKDDRLALSRALFDNAQYSDALEVMLVLDDIDELVTFAKKLAEKAQLSEAVQCYNEIITRNSSEARFYKLRGECYWEARNFDMAISDFRMMVQTEPQNRGYRRLLIQALYDSGKFDEAILEVVALNDNIELGMLGDKFISSRKYNEAIACYTHLTEKDPENARPYERRGYCYWKMKNYEMAVRDMENAVRMDPNNMQYPPLLSNILLECGIFGPIAEGSLNVLNDKELDSLGLTFFKKRRYQEAKHCYTAAINKSPSEKRYFKRRARCTMEMKDWDTTISDLRKLIELDPADQDNMVLFGQALLDSGKFDHFEEDTLSILNDTELEVLGNVLVKKGKYDEALCCYTAAVRKNPKATYYRRRGNCYWFMKDHGMALAEFIKAVQTDPSDEVNRIFLTEALYDTQRFREIPDDALNTLTTDELETLGNQFFVNSKFLEALRCYSEAINKEPGEARFYQRRGSCYAGMQEHFLAIVEYQKAVQVDSNDADIRLAFMEALYKCERFDEIPEETLNILNVDEFETMGIEFSMEGKFQEALRCYTEAMERRPNEAVYVWRRGKCYMDMAKYDVAIEEFKNALRLDARAQNIRTALLEALYYYGKFDATFKESLNFLSDVEQETLGLKFSCERIEQAQQALYCFTQAIEKRPEPRYFWRRGTCFMDLQNYDTAIIDFQNALKLNPSDQIIRSALSEALYRYKEFNEISEETLSFLTDIELESLGIQFAVDKKYREALRCYTEAIKRKPMAAYFRRRGNCYKDMLNVEAAISEYERALQQDPSDQDSRVSLFETLYQCREFSSISDETLNYLTDFELDSMADAFFSGKRFEEALRCYNKAIEKNPSEMEYYRQRGKCYWEMKDANAAIAEFRNLVLMDPGNRENATNLTAVLFEFERYDELLEDTLLLDEYEITEWGSKFFTLERYSEALRCYTEALRKNPEEAMSHAMRGFCHWRMGNLEPAAMDIKESVRLDAANLGFLIELSDDLVSAGRFDEARNALSDVIIKSAWNQEFKRLEAARKRVENLIEIRRLNDLVIYLEKLLLDDKERQINATKGGSAMYDTDSENSIVLIESSYGYYMDALKLSFAQYDLRLALEKPDIPNLERNVSLFDEPEYLVGKIHCELMSDPVTTPSGVTYDRSEIENHLRNHDTDPMTRLPLRISDLRPNRAIKEAVLLWKEENDR